MIHVAPRDEPAYFEARVRQPGREAVANGVNPLPDYWRRCLGDLYRLYDGICAYVCIHIPPVTGGRSVEHFAPKSKHPDDAYEWQNYRLVCSIMNSRKRDFEDVLDPFEVVNGWFQLQLTSMKVFPNPDLAPDVRDQVDATIERLKLNKADCLEARSNYYNEYIAEDDPLPFRLLRKWSPFVAMELERQGLRREDDQ